MVDWGWALHNCGDFLYHVSPALTGVVCGGWLVQRHFVRRANESTLIEYFSKELTDLVDETLEYWSLGYEGDTKEDKANRLRAQILEQKMKGDIKNLTAALAQYSQRYCRKIDFSSLMGEVADACTGGAFEAAHRAPDHSRYLSVVNSTHRVRWELYKRKI